MWTEIKVLLAVAITFFVLNFSLRAAEKYGNFNHTGVNLNRLYLYEGAVANVRSDEGYTLLSESCDPFSITLNNEVEVVGDPQAVIDVACKNSYYWQKTTSSPTVITATNGGVYLSFISDAPVGVTMGFTDEAKAEGLRNIKVITGLILLIAYILIWKFI